jgi:all-trans-retinol 13,14-reductase
MSPTARTALSERYDAVVIGSGIGGLAAAALLARVFGKRVLVLEKHWTLGGQTHEFSRPGGWHWDVGLHYVGEMQRGRLARRLMDFITGGRVDWHAMPAGYDHFDYPDVHFVARTDAGRYEADLREAFPAEAAAIRRYFGDVEKAARWMRKRVAASGLMPELVAAPVRLHLALTRRLPLQTTGAWLARNVRDPILRALLASQWGDYGLPPSRSAFAIHALIVQHYLDGGLYPAGGARTIADAARQVIEECGGCCLLRAEVTRILVSHGRARGVRVLARGCETEVEAPLVISDAGAHATFRRLLDPPLFPELDDRLDGLSSIALYVGLSETPARLGIDGSNHWLYEGYDHDAMAHASIEDPVSHVYLSFPSLKGGFQPHTAELASFVGYDSFAPWRRAPWKKRGADYEALKERLADEMLAMVEKRFPGFGELVAYRELSTPLSLEKFTSRERGLMYGVPATPERFRLGCLRARTPIGGLFLAGSDVGTLGIVGALMGGTAAASAAGGFTGTPQIFAALGRGSAAV